MDLARGVFASLQEGALALVGGSLVDTFLWPVESIEDPGTLLFRGGVQLGLNGILLTIFNRFGLIRTDANTGLVIYAVLFVLAQEKLLTRFRSLGAYVKTLIHSPAPLKTAKAAN